MPEVPGFSSFQICVLFFRSYGADLLFLTTNPRLAPWALFLRRFAATTGFKR